MNTISVPIPNYVKNGSTLAEWMGYFWTRLYENPDFTRNFQNSQGLLSAQLYLDYLETLNIRDRHSVPVFHRERWKPITILQSQVNKGQAGLLTIGMDPNPVIGPQTSSDFVPGDIFDIGGMVDYAGTVNYPFSGLADVMTCITDSIIAPTVVLVRDVDFIIRDSTIFFLRNNDPFKRGFPQRKFINSDGTEDSEVLLWATDAVIDAQYIYNYIGYVMGIQSESNEFYNKMLNSLWDLYNDGTPISLFMSGVGAMLGEPTVISSIEVVDRIIEEDGVRMVITDRHVYRTKLSATLRSKIVPGAALMSGEFLTESIRIYTTLDPMKLAAVSEFGERLRTDVSSLFFDKSIFRSQLQFGIGADWELSDIVCAGFDANGNPKLKFKLYGNEEDIDMFWNDFWNYCENNGISSQTCFSDYIDGIVVPVIGSVYGRVRPLEFFMRYFLKANAFIIVVEPDNIVSPPDNINPLELLTLLQDVLPAHIRMIVIEHKFAGVEDYDLSTLSETIIGSRSTTLNDSAKYGLPSVRNMTYIDKQPLKKWIPVCQN